MSKSELLELIPQNLHTEFLGLGFTSNRTRMSVHILFKNPGIVSTLSRTEMVSFFWLRSKEFPSEQKQFSYHLSESQNSFLSQSLFHSTWSVRSICSQRVISIRVGKIGQKNISINDPGVEILRKDNPRPFHQKCGWIWEFLWSFWVAVFLFPESFGWWYFRTHWLSVKWQKPTKFKILWFSKLRKSSRKMSGWMKEICLVKSVPNDYCARGLSIKSPSISKVWLLWCQYISQKSPKELNFRRQLVEVETFFRTISFAERKTFFSQTLRFVENFHFIFQPIFPSFSEFANRLILSRNIFFCYQNLTQILI